jgi:predicted signal transduction protein with EAL and GGDEF domain
LPGVDDAASALAAAQKLLDALADPFSLDALTVEVEASIGIALFPDHGDDAATLLQHADVAMYIAKAAHSGIEIYTSEHDLYSRDRLTLVGELRSALDDGQLVLHYQPKVDLRTGAVRGVEALLRWAHPTRGLLAPDGFLPAAEHTGLIRPLTSYVLEHAAAQCADWRRAGHELTVAVNLSARNLHDLLLPDEIEHVLDRWSLPPSAFDLEITESAIMADPVRAFGVAARLRELGVGLSIDDFGTGYSSLSYLKQFPISEIKIDKSFVIDMTDNDEDAAIVRSTIGLARNLGLDVVAEGVETESVRDLLTDLGCDFAQGFLLCVPLPAPDLTRWLEQSGRAVAASPHAPDRSSSRPLTRTG